MVLIAKDILFAPANSPPVALIGLPCTVKVKSLAKETEPIGELKKLPTTPTP